MVEHPPQPPEPMPVLCLGVSHHSTPVALREAVARDHDAIRRVLAEWDRDQAWSSGIGEVALISTCNRTELYVAARGPADRFTAVPPDAVRLLLGSRGGASVALRQHLQVRSGAEAVAHLCRVAAGLESMVVGESEVLGQVVAAHGVAADAGTTGLILDAAFRVAIRAGRRARAETGIGRAATSVVSEGVRLLEGQLPDLAAATVVVIGAGAMARLALGILHRRGVGVIWVVGRTLHRAEELARTTGTAAVPWSELPRVLRGADAVICTTRAPYPILGRAMVEKVIAGRPGLAPLVCIDLAVPRDIESDVRTLDGIRLFDLDDLQSRVDDNRRARESERPRVEAIIEQEVAQFQAWLHGAEMRPVLSAIHLRGEEVRQREVERFFRRHPDVDPALREEFERFSRSIVAKLLHGPSARLRTETEPARSRHYAAALQHLFGLAANGDDHRERAG
jgi:glutamyl-tRNA reductase